MSTDSKNLEIQFSEKLIKENYELLQALKMARNIIILSSRVAPDEIREIDKVIAKSEGSKE